MSTIARYVGWSAAVVAGLWAFATVAAQHVIGPHLASAKARIHIMCESQKVAQENQLSICEATGATCTKIDPVIFDAACREPE